MTQGQARHWEPLDEQMDLQAVMMRTSEIHEQIAAVHREIARRLEEQARRMEQEQRQARGR